MIAGRSPHQQATEPTYVELPDVTITVATPEPRRRLPPVSTPDLKRRSAPLSSDVAPAVPPRPASTFSKRSVDLATNPTSANSTSLALLHRLSTESAPIAPRLSSDSLPPHRMSGSSDASSRKKSDDYALEDFTDSHDDRIRPISPGGTMRKVRAMSAENSMSGSKLRPMRTTTLQHHHTRSFENQARVHGLVTRTGSASSSRAASFDATTPTDPSTSPLHRSVSAEYPESRVSSSSSHTLV